MITKAKLSRYLNIPTDDINYGTDVHVEDSKIVEIVNNEETTIEYYIGDFRKYKIGDSNSYLEQLNKLDIDTQPLLIFNQWEDEQDFLDIELSNSNYTGKQKKDTKILFNRARIIYFSNENEVYLNLENDGINYLEYESKNVEGFIYNISLFELKNLYNVTGKNLFKDNVRIGTNNPKAMRLKKEFENTFEIGLYHLFKKNKSALIPIINIEDYLNSKLITNYNNKSHILEEFWFHHNGITIFSDNDYSVLGNLLTLSSDKVSVINGAQTLTHCFSLIREISQVWIKKFGKEFDSEEIEIFNQYIEKLQKSIILKVIFLKSNLKDDSTIGYSVKQSITHGLNHQIPIDQEDIQANSANVEQINHKLASVGMKICRVGEYIDHQNNFSLVEMLKNHLTYIGKPGEARNMTKNDLEIKLNALLSYVTHNTKEELQNFSSTMSMFFLIDTWWKKRVTIESDDSTTLSSIDGLNRNGKYYFKAYCKILINLTDFETQTDYTLFFQFYFEKFLTIFTKLSGNEIISSNTLKNDELFKLFKLHLEENNNENSQVSTVDFNIKDLNIEDLKNYMIDNIKSSTAKSSHSNLIKTYLRDIKHFDFLFRTITFQKDKHIPTEAFPFSSNTFKQFYLIEDYPDCYSEKDVNFTYHNSELKETINTKFNLFVITLDEEKEISDLKLLEEISFSKYNSEAEKVFNKTLDAFKSGNADIFVKSSDDATFHVRPKALNSQDTFTFTNGDQEIKRTFWANKETINDLIESN